VSRSGTAQRRQRALVALVIEVSAKGPVSIVTPEVLHEWLDPRRGTVVADAAW
jgi:hypothetical protein